MIAFLWQACRGYRLRPWRSPYLRWRMETYWGWHAERIAPRDFFNFVRDHWRDLARFLAWASEMRHGG